MSGRDGRDLHQAVFQELLEALLVAGALLGELGPQPRVVAKLEDSLSGTNEGRSMPRSFSFASQIASSLSSLDGSGRSSRPERSRATRQRLSPRGAEKKGLQESEVASLEDDPLDPELGELVGEGHDRPRRRLHVPDPRDPSLRAGQAHAHLAGGLRDADRSGALEHLLLFVRVDLLDVVS